MNTPIPIQSAIDKHLAGDYTAAAHAYQEILAVDPNNADAWNLSGVLAHQLGQHARGIEYIFRAVQLQDDVPEYYLNLATALLAHGQVEEARWAALKCLELDPDHKLAWNVLGNCQYELHRPTESLAAFERARQIDPDHADTWVNEGRVHRELGQYEDAERCTRRALELVPDHFEALNNLGAVYQSMKRHEDAVGYFEQACRVRPSVSKVSVNLGNALQDCHRYSEAETAFQRAIDLDGHNANAWSSMGLFYQSIAQTDDALTCFRMAMELDPNHVAAGSNYLFGLNLAQGMDTEHIYREHIRVSQRHVEHTCAPNQFPLPKQNGRRLRVGYVSPDFRNHPTNSFFEPVVVHHDRTQFEVILYSDVRRPDQTTVRFSEMAEIWRPIVGIDDEPAVHLIREDGVDILVDLNGHTADNRLGIFGRRGAPIQVSMIGYPNTTGVPTIDYFVTDEVRDPPQYDDFYVEEVVRLPGGMCWKPPKESPAPGVPPCVDRGYVTFGSTHRPNKLTDDALGLWSKVLSRVPDSRLLIFHNNLRNNDQIQGQLLRRCAAAGLDPARIDIACNTTNEYLTAYHEIDILLDAIPWSSGTTARESLWMGVPVPSILGKLPCGRACSSVLNRVDLWDLVAESSEQYVDVVANLAGDTDRLVALRSGLRNSMQSTVCDGQRFVRELENEYRRMWERRCHAA